MAIYREIPSNIVESVSLSFYTPDDVRKLSVKNITSPELLDAMGVQTPGGLYDPAMGPINEADSCKTCGQQLHHCPGHCGHIELVKPLFNPLMFGHLRSLLNITCLFCHNFRIEEKKVRHHVAELEHIVKGDTASARRIGQSPLSEIFQADIKVEDMKMKNDYKDMEEKSWTSLQHADYLAVLTELFKGGSKKCAKCGRTAPKIESPTFGWLKKKVRSSDIRADFIRGCTSVLPSIDEDRLEDAVSGDASGSGEMVTSPTTVSDQLRTPLEFVKRMHTSAGEGHLLPSEVELILKGLWRNETQLCMLLCNIQQNSIAGSNKLHSMFFLESLVVPPSKFRPSARGSRGDIEHSHNVLLHKVQEANCALRELIADDPDHPDTIKRWMNLQMSVNLLFNSTKGLTKSEKENNGYCQSLEKKKGVFRQNMMGKRANFTARTVVTPDPFLKVHEIGIPECFAIKLSYPERVTPRNVDELRYAVANGADKYPGASHFVDKGISYKLNVTKDICKAISRKLSTSRVSTSLSGKSPEHEYEEKVVNRHLKDGDVVLANRQPTLHKPSMMAFEVRILKEVKTMRMHYANCRSFNLDFDGDEINIHLPQDEIARAEAINIVNANKQYISQTNGEPIRGLIQDHIISAFLLSKKDMFLTREEYHQLLYASCATLERSTQPGKFGEKVRTLISDKEIEPLHPAIWKPRPLWTGKQVFTAILCHVTRGYSPFTIEKDGKIGKEYIAEKCEERKLYIYNNELIHGVIDKAQFEKYGLVHTVHKLYGANVSGNLLSIFSRLFTTFLHMHAFTCGVEDILLLKKSYMQREQLLNKCEELSEKAHLCFISQRDDIERELTPNESEELSEKAHLRDIEREQTPNESEELSEKAHLRDIGPLQLHREIEKILRCRGESAIARLDRRMFDAFSTLTSDVNDKVIPKGLQKPFPKNCISLMTTTGAKGGKVNFTNITSLLGQVSLEGKRVPRIISGKTLPCFPPWDTSCRAGGYISDCFLTGLRPQEYYFYCMAGRDGLVDTAIKTASIGYLQRRLIKNLESLKVCYDYTVRDADGSIVQFTYGEDGVDVSKTSYITDGADVKKEKYIPELKVLANNQQVVLESLGQSGNGDLSSLNGFIEELPESLREKAAHFARHISESGKGHHIEEKDLMKLVNLTYLSRLANPGEAVGVIAGQSVGEPSTQMTLNTFHLAGQGEANVTLGIPRLQEILMNAKENVKTSIMACPLPKWSTKDDAKCLAVNLRRICVADIIQSIDVSVRANYIHNGRASTLYKLEMKLYRTDHYPHTKVTLRTTFVNAVEVAIRKHLALTSRINNINVVFDKQEAEEVTEEDIDGGSGDNRAGDNDDDQDDDNAQNEDADAERRKKQSSDEVEYEDNDLDSDPESGTESGVDWTEAEGGDYEVRRDDESDILPDKEMPDSPSRTIAQDSKKRPKAKKDGPKRKTDSVLISVRVKGSKFKAYFALTDEPYILLAQIARDTAKSVFIKESKNIEKCSVVEPKQGSGGNRFELQTVGVNFPVFWDLQDQLDINKLYVTDVHSMLKTYGVEAARATIIKEVKAVFGLYGIEVNIRHLSLIADYMTSHGALRPMNRFGIAYSTSPFSKMTMETASKFIADAAFHAERDTLQSPSASISLGQPVKLGTGVFDLLHNY